MLDTAMVKRRPDYADYILQAGLRAVQRAEQIHLHHPTEHLRSRLGEPASVNDPCVVDQDVDPAERLTHRRHRLQHLVSVRDVAR